MDRRDVRVWGIHAHKAADAHESFLEQAHIAIGWWALGDLGTVGADRLAALLRNPP